MSKRSRYIFLLVIFGLAGVVAVAAVGIRVYLSSQACQSYIQERLSGQMPGAVSWQAFRLALWRGEFEWHGLRLEDHRNDPVLQVEHLSVRLEWRTLLQRELTVAQVRIQNPRISVRQETDGRLNLAAALTTAKPDREPLLARKPILWPPSLPLNVVLQSLHLSQGALDWRAAPENAVTRFNAIDLKAAVDLGARTGTLSLDIGSLVHGHRDHDRTLLEGLHLEARLVEERLEAVRLTARAAESRLQLTGSLSDILAAVDLNLDLTVETSLDEMQQTMHSAPAVSGPLDARVTARGSLNDPRITATLAYGGGRIWDQAVERIDLTARLADRIVQLERLESRSPWGDLDLKGRLDLQRALPEGLLSTRRDPDALVVDLSLKARELLLHALPLNPGRWQGRLNADIDLAFAGLSPASTTARVDVNIDAREVSLDPAVAPVDVGVQLEARVADGAATVTGLQARIGEAEIQSSGKLDWAQRSFTADTVLTAADLKRALAPLGIDGVDGGIHMTTRAAGTIEHPRVDIELEGRQLRFRDITLGDARLDARLDESGKLDIRALSLRNGPANLSARGSVQILDDRLRLNPDPSADLTLDLKTFDPGEFMPTLPLAGTWDARLELDGSLKAPAAVVALEGRGLAFETVPLGDLQATLRLERGQVIAERIELRNGDSHLEAAGRIGLLAPGGLQPLKDPSFEAEIRAEGLQVRDFVPDIQARCALRARLDGSLAQPRGQLTLGAEAIDLGAQRLAGLQLRASLAGDRLRLESLDLRPAADEHIRGHGWLDRDRTFAFNLACEGLDLTHIDSLAEREIAEGRLRFELVADGHLDRPRMRAEAYLGRLAVGGKALPDASLKIDLAGQQLRLNGALYGDFDACYDLANRDFNASLSLADTALNPFFKLVGQPQLGGTASGRVEIAGNAAAPDRASGQIVMDRLEVWVKATPLVRSEALRLDLDAGRLTIAALDLVVLEQGRLRAVGSGGLDWPLDIRLDGSIPLAVVAPMAVDLAPLEGRLDLTVHVGGSFGQPDLAGQIDLRDLGFDLPGLGSRVQTLNGRIELTPQVVTLRQVVARLGGGVLQLDGSLDLDRWRPVRSHATLRAQNLPLNVPDTLDLVLNADLNFSSQGPAAALAGELTLLEGRYYRDVKLNYLEGLIQPKRQTAVAAAPMRLPYFEELTLDVALKHRAPLVVENNLALLELVPDLHLGGTFNRPVLSGRAHVDSGTITYRKRAFTVDKGLIDFVNPYKIEPSVELESSVEVREWQIFLSVSGTWRDVRFTLRSEPAEEDGDILSLLLIGRTNRELIQGEGGTAQAPRQMLAQMVADSLKDDIKNATGLDIFETDVHGGDANDGNAGVKVTVGKDLSRHLALKYSVDSKNGQMVQQAVAEYRLLETVLLSAFQDNQGAFGGSLKYRLEFR